MLQSGTEIVVDPDRFALCWASAVGISSPDAAINGKETQQIRMIMSRLITSLSHGIESREKPSTRGLD